MELYSIKELDIDNKRVFIRCDFNVPKDEFGNITDDRRIRAALPTIRYCMDRDCKIILASHFGRPKAGEWNEEKDSLQPVAKRLHSLLKKDILMAKNVVGDDTIAMAQSLEEGDILLLENLRYNLGETANDSEFAARLASMADIYINDAFGASHRKHASIFALPEHFKEGEKAAGFLMQKEVIFFDKMIKNPSRPFIAVVGGSKVSGKLQALVNLVEKVDKIIIGGGMAFTFLKAQGYEIGTSLVEDDLLEDAKKIMKRAKELDVKFYLPVDLVVAPEFSDEVPVKFLPIQEIPKGWMGLDIGPATNRLFREALNDAQTILWNGPMGVYEMDIYSKGSFMMSHYIAESHATTIVGGGDTADVAQRAGDVDEMTFISTGGGASLELLEGKLLPGIEAVSKKIS
ncbi:MAG TPA: phosphoglycerate kinase [Campylobacterales bacterium]|nr:phosphoglycerate kinase [Campylobacterales bacterium]